MLCSAVHASLENQLTATRLALPEVEIRLGFQESMAKVWQDF